MIFSVPDGQIAEADIRRLHERSESIHSKTETGQYLRIGNNQYLRRNISGNVHHCDFGKLFDTFHYHLSGKTAEAGKVILRIRCKGQVQIECRDVGGTCLHHPRTLYLGQGRHRPVYLFVDFDIGIVDVRPVAEFQLNDCVPVP